jgi:hypothetical protein
MPAAARRDGPHRSRCRLAAANLLVSPLGPATEPAYRRRRAPGLGSRNGPGPRPKAPAAKKATGRAPMRLAGVCYNSAMATDPKSQDPPQDPTSTLEQPAKPKLVFPADWIDKTAEAVAAGEIIVMVPAPRRG